MASPKINLFIIYNADGGIFSALADAVHKIVSPATYPCSLCAITYGPVAMRNSWKSFLKSLPIDTIFYHRDDFAAAWPDVQVALPAIMLHTLGQPPQTLISADELNTSAGLDGLIEVVSEKLAIRGVTPLSE